MVYIVGNIKDKKYDLLIRYLYTKCNKITFFITDFSIKLDKANITKYHFGKPIVSLDEHELNPSFLEYINLTEKKVPVTMKNVLRKYFDFKYPHTVSDRLILVYEIKFTEEVLYELININRDLYSFNYPDLPEDICFYSEDRILVSTICHEEECVIEMHEDETVTDLIKTNEFAESDFIYRRDIS
ncbi:MAG: hypothetical protein JEZ05_10780 [Tenericutes bacterium]|nr:hypothetical protein [Mycoplasmatota bacterium]